MSRSLAVLALICVAVAGAIWLEPASIHIVAWPQAHPVRVALLPPLSRLWWALGSACAVMGVVAAVARSRGPAAPGTLARLFAPLLLLLLWVVPYLPWLPDRAPLMLALAGPVRWVIAGVAILGTVASRVRLPDWPLSPGRWSVFAISLAIYSGFGFKSAASIGPGADEPHYLIITHSLLVDHDLAIENNHTSRDYRAFFGGELHPDYLQRGRNEVIYSVHAPGLPAILLPAYAIAGYRGAVAMLCLIAALTAVAVFDLAALLVGTTGAVLTWAAVCLTVPFLPHAWLIFPEMPGALIVAWAALWLWIPLPDRSAPWVWRGLALSVLPWLHTKFVVLLVVLTAVLLLRLWRRATHGVALVAPIAASLALWLHSFYRMYGVVDPLAPYGAYARLYSLNANIPRGLLGILFDQKFGLLFYSPVYWLAAVGCWLMLRRADLRTFGAALTIAAIAFVISATRFYMWWGGSSAPARFLVPVLPLAAPMVAVAIHTVRSASGRAALAVMLAVSLAISITASALPEHLLLFSEPHGYARIVEALQAGSPLAIVLPTFTSENWHAPLLQLLPWVFAGLVGLIVVTIVTSRRRVPLAAFWTVALGVVTFGLTGSLFAPAPDALDRTAATTRGKLSLMDAYDGTRLSGFNYGRRTTLDGTQVLAAGAISALRRPGASVDDPQWLEGPFELPPGRYEARLWFDGGAPHNGAVLLTLQNHFVLARTEGPLNNPTSMSFELPVPAALWVGLSARNTAQSVRRVDIEPRFIVPRSDRPIAGIHRLEPIEHHPGAFIVYADENSYPEGGVFWTRDTRRGEVLVAPAGASTLVLTLHLGPVGGRVRLRVAGQDRDVELARDETRQVEIPLPAGATLVPVSVQAPGTFRPAEVDPRSDDVRWLGCQVRIDLR